MQNYRSLDIWQKSHGLAMAIYKVTADFPVAEAYGLTSQVRRATVSIPSYLMTSNMLMTRLMKKISDQIDHVRRMLISLIKKTRE